MIYFTRIENISDKETGEMAQHLITSNAFTEDPSSTSPILGSSQLPITRSLGFDIVL